MDRCPPFHHEKNYGAQPRHTSPNWVVRDSPLSSLWLHSCFRPHFSLPSMEHRPKICTGLPLDGEAIAWLMYQGILYSDWRLYCASLLYLVQTFRNEVSITSHFRFTFGKYLIRTIRRKDPVRASERSEPVSLARSMTALGSPHAETQKYW